jgi:hypothetical protein
MVKPYQIIAGGEPNSTFDRWVEALQRAGIRAKQMSIASYDRESGYNPNPHSRETEVYVLVPSEKLDEALAIVKSLPPDKSLSFHR